MRAMCNGAMAFSSLVLLVWGMVILWRVFFRPEKTKSFKILGGIVVGFILSQYFIHLLGPTSLVEDGISTTTTGVLTLALIIMWIIILVEKAFCKSSGAAHSEVLTCWSGWKKILILRICVPTFAAYFLVQGFEHLVDKAGQTKEAATKMVNPPYVARQLTSQDLLWSAFKNSKSNILYEQDYHIDYSSSTKVATLIRGPVKSGSMDKWFVNDALEMFINFGIGAFKIHGVDDVKVVFEGEFITSYGKKVTAPAVAFGMSEAEFNKYNWPALTSYPVSLAFKISCNGDFYIHPAIRSEMSEGDLTFPRIVAK